MAQADLLWDDASLIPRCHDVDRVSTKIMLSIPANINMTHIPILSPDFFQDMNPTYDWLRENEPVHFIEAIDTWFVSRYVDVVAILQDNDNFSVEDMPIAKMWHPDVKEATRTLFMDDPDHARLRGVMRDFFALPSIIKRESMVAEIVNNAIRKVKDSGKTSIDIEKEFAYTIPIDVVSVIMGLPREDFQLFHDWAPKLNRAVIPTLSEAEKDEAGQTAREVGAYLIEHFRKGNLKPQGEDTVMSLLKDAVDSGVMAEDEMIPQAVQLYIGGHETTLQLIGLCLHQVLKHPAEMAKLRANPDLIQKAVDETVRIDGVSQVIVRRVAKDYTLHGVTMKANDMLFLGNGAANRDPEIFENPLVFDIERKRRKPHLGFGNGIRYCLGNHLGKMEARLAVNALLNEFPNIRLPDDHQPDYNSNMMMRGLLSLQVELA